MRRELPAVAAQVAEELRRSTPAFAAVSRRIGTEATQTAVEQALLLTLGLRPAPDPQQPRIPQQRRKPARVVTPMPGTRARQALFAALADDRCIPADVLAELAAQAAWPLPRRVRAVVLAGAGAGAGTADAPVPAPHLVPPPSPQLTSQLAAALGQGLPGTVEADLCLLIPDPGPRARPALEAALDAALGGRPAAVGHSVPVAEAAASLRWARRLLGLSGAVTGPAERITFVDDHLSDLLVLQDESLARALSARWLRPLDDLTPRQSERLEVTLLAWLESGGAPEAARTLNVHPQTVRYRLRQIEKLFGPAMREPHSRFELELALRSRRLMARARLLRSRAHGSARALGAAVHPLGAAGRAARVNGL
ncbi:PucR family transcriptional regulator [Streptomyces roseoverticillatus]|uniref:Helix-turn-helix domain-containing protein n=1 Tax=Streptomyces roseoverticillatus TaxID=66429 RepID=A0ABV3J0R0_9ACTN